jgi:hypothetical protein
LDTVIGGISIYLGYRLFLKLPEKTDSQGKVVLPGNISIYLSRVGPGVFFALFGAAVIALSLHHTIQYTVEPKEFEVAQTSQTKVTYKGATADNPDATFTDLEHRRSLLRPSLFWLNQLPNQVSGFKNEEGMLNMQLQLPTIKLELLGKVWGPDWCGFDTFAQWVNRGTEAPLPAGQRDVLLRAAIIYVQGGGRCDAVLLD